MNEPVSWDSTLIKKYRSSNHYKLLNQLRNEVKKYPLNNKKKSSSINSKNSNLDSYFKSSLTEPQKNLVSNNSNDVNSNKSTVSFNNSKNFSIYNQTINSSNSQRIEALIPDQSKLDDDSLNPTFIERLNNIDMK
mgnify:CR=1 FL=1